MCRWVSAFTPYIHVEASSQPHVLFLRSYPSCIFETDFHCDLQVVG